MDFEELTDIILAEKAYEDKKIVEIEEKDTKIIEKVISDVANWQKTSSWNQNDKHYIELASQIGKITIETDIQ